MTLIRCLFCSYLDAVIWKVVSEHLFEDEEYGHDCITSLHQKATWLFNAFFSVCFCNTHTHLCLHSRPQDSLHIQHAFKAWRVNPVLSLQRAASANKGLSAPVFAPQLHFQPCQPPPEAPAATVGGTAFEVVLITFERLKPDKRRSPPQKVAMSSVDHKAYKLSQLLLACEANLVDFSPR